MNDAKQVLYAQCTAKWPGGLQCSVPVFDVIHERPLCDEHARKKVQCIISNTDFFNASSFCEGNFVTLLVGTNCCGLQSIREQVIREDDPCLPLTKAKP